MRFSVAIASLFAVVALAQNCGPKFNNQKCAAGNCCSGAGWCDVTPAHCDSATCQPAWSGSGSSCKAPTPTSNKNRYATTVPEIDVCGSTEGGVSCPGAGTNLFFYRCCSSVGHCGPKNTIQDQGQYCGQGCQRGFGKCDSAKAPPNPAASPKTVGEGRTCGPIVNAKCGNNLCCSGSNFCGSGPDFCGAANWCQPRWGRCDSTTKHRS